MVAAWNTERKLHIAASPGDLDIVSESPDPEGMFAALSRALPGCVQALGLSELTGVGASAVWTLAAENVNDAETALERWLMSPSLRTIMNPLGGRPDDLIVDMYFTTDTGLSSSFRIEPATDEQAAKGSFFISDRDVSEFSPGLLIMRIDRRQKRENLGSEAVARAQRHLEQVLTQGRTLMATVESEDASPAAD
jgi:hypothetical protein